MTQPFSEQSLSIASEPPIILGITGSVAAYKAAELARLWVKSGRAVDVVMTENACRFVTPLTMQALSGRPVCQDLWRASEDGMRHISLSRSAAAIVVAPTSADFLARLAQGRADDLLAALCLARECPLFVAPAMNRQMWFNPATQRNVAQLVADGVTLLGPDYGEMACGESGEGRMLSPQAIVDAVVRWLRNASSASAILARRRVLITAGPTFETIDAVRGLTNRSSGKMGFALADAAARAGADVTLVAGPVNQPTPMGVARIDVTSAAQMADAVFSRAEQTDVFIGVAAVADFTPTNIIDDKIKKDKNEILTLTLAPTVDILDELGRRAPHIFRVGFAAETQNLAQFGEEKRRRKKLPLLIVNHAAEAFSSDENEVLLLDDHGQHPLPKMSKRALATRLIEEIAQRIDS
ncbi:MAG: bifunctional phosphopantothenoylcysteine decarboxylase/phosphopantothenate--cysteine ligase CoaBC [Burkholderiales bacterium]|jgi:phosphopantothenoylcysteine decarboxylase/phosphopantothenate--cysteine ligase|nr:bifunctional phosphopantothenoylcysteine decarboxylase/phosphopantothenate--cysteine ligase CoaBC [Burkholderiales bacterium]